MAEIELSLMERGVTTPEDIKRLVEPFERHHRATVKVRILPWETGWADLIKVALYRDGPAVSEVGSTWIGSLAAMEELRPFTPQELRLVGDRASFVPGLWQGGMLDGSATMWGIPWLSDTRIIYYRRDLLASAGIDERDAFATPENLARTLARLLEKGGPCPWVVPTARGQETLHDMSSWLWGAGGDFVASNGKRTLFVEPEALAAMQLYFDLHRYLVSAAQGLDATQATDAFLRGEAAVTISGPWLLGAVRHRQPHIAPVVAENLALALPPGVPFVGGSHLVVWKHTRQGQLAVDLVRYLTSVEVQVTLGQQMDQLPVRIEALTHQTLATDPAYQVLVRALQEGRAFHSLALWGLVEDKLSAAFGQIWADLRANPDLDLAQALRQRLEPLAQRLNASLRARQ